MCNMEVNTVYIYAEEYRDLIEKAERLKVMEGAVEALKETAEEMQLIEAWFEQRPWVNKEFLEWKGDRKAAEEYDRLTKAAEA